MQTNTQLVHVGQRAYLELGNTRAGRITNSSGAVGLARAPHDVRRGEVWEDCVWLLMAVASAGVLVLSLTLRV